MFIKLRVHPDSKKSKIRQTANDAYEIWVKAPAVRGLANREALEILSSILGKPAGKFRLVKGAHSPTKIVQVL